MDAGRQIVAKEGAKALFRKFLQLFSMTRLKFSNDSICLRFRVYILQMEQVLISFVELLGLVCSLYMISKLQFSLIPRLTICSYAEINRFQELAFGTVCKAGYG